MHGKGGQTGETPVVVVRKARSRQHHHKRGDEGKEMDHQSKEPISDTTRVRTRVKQICNLTCALRTRAFFVRTTSLWSCMLHVGRHATRGRGALSSWGGMPHALSRAACHTRISCIFLVRMATALRSGERKRISLRPPHSMQDSFVEFVQTHLSPYSLTISSLSTRHFFSTILLSARRKVDSGSLFFHFNVSK